MNNYKLEDIQFFMKKRFVRKSSAGVVSLMIQGKELVTRSFRQKEELSKIMTKWNQILWGTGILAYMHVKHHYYEGDE